MSKSLSYVLVTPYTIAKSRTGGVLARLLSRTDLSLVGAQIFAADEKFAVDYANILRVRAPANQLMLLADYAEKSMGPSGGRPHRSLFLLFYGEDPCEKLLDVCGHIYTQHVEVDAISGETIRDTYSDLIFSPDNPNEVRYFEPAVFTPRNQEEANIDLKLIADFLDTQPNIVENIKYPDPSKIERTLVIIKPDNWTYNSSRPGTIVDMFSRTGLRIISVKIHRFSLAEAIDFYSPVRDGLRKKLAVNYGIKAQELLEKEFGFKISSEFSNLLQTDFGVECAKDQFDQIIEFMSGQSPDMDSGDPKKESDIKCMIMVYEGANAINKIRDVLGATDPQKARDGTIRREFGSNIMVNTAHASDSSESYEREKDIVRIDHNSVASIIREHLS